jgi:hypothetical protein
MELIETNAAKNRVEVTFIGNYSGDIASFNDQLKACARAAKFSSGHFDLLSDFTQSQVMPQQLSGETAEIVGWCAANGLRKSANIVSSMLLKMQLDRLVPDDHFKTFLNRDDAEAWLAE